MSINELSRRSQHDYFLLKFLIVLFLTFDFVKNFPVNENFTSSTLSKYTETQNEKDEEAMAKEALVKSFNGSWIVEEFEDEIPTLPTVKCDTSLEQLCDNGIECILKQFMCDGRENCADGSDELPDICHQYRADGYVDSKGRFLPPTLKCPEPWFFCKDASRCIEPASACDGVAQCEDGSDEGAFCRYLNVERRIPSTNETHQFDEDTY